jgi:hypothetical protein
LVAEIDFLPLAFALVEGDALFFAVRFEAMATFYLNCVSLAHKQRLQVERDLRARWLWMRLAA